MDLPEISTGVATVYFYGKRRFLSKRGAFQAKARDMMRGDLHGRNDGHGPCDCFYCNDVYGDHGTALKAITRALMREEPIPQHYAEQLPTPEANASAGGGE